MYRRVISHCSHLRLSRVFLLGLVLGMAIEVLTACCRFGLGMQSTRDTEWMAALTFGLRLHHGYFGVILLGVAWMVWKSRPGVRNLLAMIGVGLIGSDLVHHFVVLWLSTGSPEFDFVYP